MRGNDHLFKGLGITLSSDPSALVEHLNNEVKSTFWEANYIGVVPYRDLCEVYDEFSLSIRMLADEWILSRHQLSLANHVGKVLKEFVDKHPLEVVNLYAPDGRGEGALYFRDAPDGIGDESQLPDVRKRAMFEAGRLTLAMVCSEWSKQLFRCQRCGRYFVSKNPQVRMPRCSRKCRNNELTKKQRQRVRDHIKRLSAAREAYIALSQQASWKRNTFPAVAIAERANKKLPPRLQITQKFVAREIIDRSVGVSNYAHIFDGQPINQSSGSLRNKIIGKFRPHLVL